MAYKFLRKFLGLRDGESARRGGSGYVFSCGVGWYSSIGGMAITRGQNIDMHNVAFILNTKDNSESWRKKLDKITSEAEYDITVIKKGA